MIANRQTGSLIPAFFISLAGLAFCLWNAWDAASVPCVTAGCTLYQSFSFGGISLWWGGVALFVLLMALAMSGRAALGRFCAGCALLGDCILLVIMLLTLPCLACMIVASLIALAYWQFRRALFTHTNPLRLWSCLLLLWGLLFLGNLAGAVRSEVDPWPLLEGASGEGTPVRIFFSPSCSACRQLVTGISEAESKKISWYPVAEEERDLAIILNLQQRLELGGTLSGQFLAALDTPQLSAWDMLQPSALMLQFRMWCNKAEVILSGDGRIPFVQFLGVPSALIKNSGVSSSSPAIPAPVTTPNFGGQTTIDGKQTPNSDFIPLDLGTTGSCGGGTTVPCP